MKHLRKFQRHVEVIPNLPDLSKMDSRDIAKLFETELEKKKSDLVLVKHILEYGAIDLNKNNYEGYLTPLHIVARDGNYGLATLFLEMGADMHRPETDGTTTPLDYALIFQDSKMIRIFLNRIDDINIQDNDGYSKLHDAVQGNKYTSARLLLEYGANPNIRDFINGSTPLFLAVEKGYEDMLILLLENNGEPNTLNDDGVSLADSAIAHDREEFIDILIKYGYDY